MRESVKAVLALLVIVCVLLSILAWSSAWSNVPERMWFLRVLSPLLGLGALVLLCRMQWRKDKVPDFLRQHTRSFFERDGLCFAIEAEVEDDTCIVQILFQNRYERPCEASIALRPASGFFLTRKKIKALAADVQCVPAAFGVVRVPLPVPEKYQGRKVSFDVGASVSYPQGRGRILRFKDGTRVGKASFSSPGGAALTLAGMFAGQVVMSRPASVKLALPVGVRQELPDDTPVQVETFWQLGDPLPDHLTL